MLLKPLPYAEPERVVRLWETNRPFAIDSFSASVPNFLSWQERSQSFAGLAAFREESANLSGDGQPERVSGLAVSATFWDTLGLRPVQGRAFLREEDAVGRDRVVMLSEGLWRRRYAADPGLVGKTIPINGEERRVVGIAPQDVGFARDVDVWVPLAPDPATENRSNHMITVLGRLKPGLSVAQAEAELNQVAAQLEREFPNSNRDWRVRLAPALDWLVNRNLRTSLIVLLAGVGLLLLAACANVANLQLARASARRAEIGVRLALGASRARLARQMATESLVLAALGGALGILLALAGMRGLVALLPADVPRAASVRMDVPVLLFALAATAVTGLLFGVLPAMAASRLSVAAVLQEAGRGAAGPGRSTPRQALVAVQMALATILVVGAALLAQSFARLQTVDLGFRPDHVMTASLSLPQARYTTMDKAEAFYRALLAEVRALPGVESAGLASNVPFGGGNTSMGVEPVGRSSIAPEKNIQAAWRIVTADYLRALKVPLRRGRLFEEHEDQSRRPIMLSEGLARRLWPDGSDPVGRQVRVGGMPPSTVVGVVGEVRQLALAEEPMPTMYMPISWYIWPTMTLVVRTTMEPGSMAASLRRVVARLDAAQPVFDIRTMDRLVSNSAARPRLHTTLLAGFALLALVLGAVGVAGVVAYTVARRTQELGLRMALGASPGRVAGEVARAGLVVCAWGLAAGLVGAWALGRVIAGLLFGVRPDDAPTFVVTGLVLLAVAFLACWLPARRATRIDPMVALKSE